MYGQEDNLQSKGQEIGLTRGAEQQRTSTDVSARGFTHDQMSGTLTRGTDKHAATGHRPGGAAKEDTGMKRGREDRPELAEQERGSLALQEGREAQSLPTEELPRQFHQQKQQEQPQQQQEQFKPASGEERQNFDLKKEKNTESQGGKRTGAELLRDAEEHRQDISTGETGGLGAQWSETAAATAFPEGGVGTGELAAGSKFEAQKITRETPADMAARAAAGDPGQKKRELEEAAIAASA